LKIRGHDLKRRGRRRRRRRRKKSNINCPSEIFFK
jgi:hypothetical protein